MEEVSFEMGAERPNERTVVDCRRKRFPDLGCGYTKALCAKGVAGRPESDDWRERGGIY